MKEVKKIALAALLHDIGKFAQRADIPLREPFQKGEYGYKHSAYTAQVLQDYFNDIEGYHQYAFEHHIVGPTSDEESWIVAAADRLASGFEREEFEEYNTQQEDFRRQRLMGIFDESKRHAIAPLGVDTIFATDQKPKGNEENEYKSLWDGFVGELEKLYNASGTQSTDLLALEYLLKKYTSFIPSATTFKGKYKPLKANIPLYDHLHATALFAAAIAALSPARRKEVIEYYRFKDKEPPKGSFLLLNGDFFGIQQFIFNDIETKAAAKVLRGKSAFVQILSRTIALHIVKETGVGPLGIISEAAGKFEILLPNEPAVVQKLHRLKQKLDSYFVRSFFGETGVGLSWIECGIEDFIKKGAYQKLRDRLAEEVEKVKLRKFSLHERSYDIAWEKGLSNTNQCFACKKRIGKKRHDVEKLVCDSCYRYILIGKHLAKPNFMRISYQKSDIEIFEGYYLDFPQKAHIDDMSVALYDIAIDEEFRGYPKWEIGAYVATDENGAIVTFEELAKRSVKEGIKEGKREFGVEALMSLKGDVDNMGNFLRKQSFGSFAKYNFFSRLMDYFFSVYVPHLMRKKYPNTYTVFAGGDDLFVLGAWDETIELAKEVRRDFMRFAQGSGLSFSVGMVMSKPTKPISFIAEWSEKALENAKEMSGKDAIFLFGETIKWDEYFQEEQECGVLDHYQTTAFFYRLLELSDMSKRAWQGDPQGAMWKSKLRYMFARNIDPKFMGDLAVLDKLIERHPQKMRVCLSEHIYKRRKA